MFQPHELSYMPTCNIYVSRLVLLDKRHEKFTRESKRRKATYIFLPAAGQTLPHRQPASYLHLEEYQPVSAAKRRQLLVSAHLLHVGRQHECWRQKHVSFVHHLSLTGSVVVSA